MCGQAQWARVVLEPQIPGLQVMPANHPAKGDYL